jgi:hypothetical protein
MSNCACESENRVLREESAIVSVGNERLLKLGWYSRYARGPGDALGRSTRAAAVGDVVSSLQRQ